MDVDRIARDPKYAPVKRKSHQKTRSVRDLFADVDQEPVFKDKRGRPWVKNPRAYAKAQLAMKRTECEIKSPTTKQAMDQEDLESKCAEEEQLNEKHEDSENDSMSERESDESDTMSQDSRSTSTESDTEHDPGEILADLQEADWHELTKDAAPATTIGKRLALLHFDWDNAKAENIYMVLESFLPPRGHIECVTTWTQIDHIAIDGEDV
ncbi:unnamed protein product [Echinostoma caproni]|uniref:CAF1C_H4-bd domain-containing protein n=1 Tax=Echinostoma caproni TaxID=27848 RepID=A0A183BE08_9TREM|nr:unnamed protein product [Echinostoma caproni]